MARVSILRVPADYFLFALRCVLPPWDFRRTVPRFVEQVINHGLSALPVVILAAAFVGLTTAVQTSYQLMGTVPKFFVGMGVGRLVLIELAPVFGGFIVAGRSASAIAAELGSMRVSDQTDALSVMGVDTYRYLCLPRILATTVSLPILVVVMELVAIATAIYISDLALGVPAATFMYGMYHFFVVSDFIGGLVKALVFGLLIGLNGCFFGFNVTGGAEGVGRSTTRAVVLSATLILVVDFFLAVAFFRI